MSASIVDCVNAKLHCEQCGHAGTWARDGRARKRRNSTIVGLRCGHCGARIVAKVVTDDGLRPGLQREYQVLGWLAAEFPQDAHFGTLTPLARIDTDDASIAVTRRACGQDLGVYLAVASAADVDLACTRAGMWLRKLHAIGAEKSAVRSLGVAGKLQDLAHDYGAIVDARRGLRRVRERLVQTGATVDRVLARPVRIHGDCKPQNFLYDGTRCVGLDIRWDSVGLPEHDLASFLDHAWLRCQPLYGRRRRVPYKRVAAQFLAGYGDSFDVSTLRWAQLYFALRRYCSYRQRGPLHAAYGQLKVWPLVRYAMGELRDGV